METCLFVGFTISSVYEDITEAGIIDFVSKYGGFHPRPGLILSFSSE